MKKFICLILTVAVCLGFSACNDNKSQNSSVDIDLTKMSSTMVYAEVYNMVNQPTEYLGKTVRVNGIYTSSFYEPTQNYYHFVVIADATACCSQGLEFIWDGHSNINDFPEEGTEIEIEGVFGTYDELDVTYYYISTESIKKI